MPESKPRSGPFRLRFEAEPPPSPLLLPPPSAVAEPFPEPFSRSAALPRFRPRRAVPLPRRPPRAPLVFAPTSGWHSRITDAQTGEVFGSAFTKS